MENKKSVKFQEDMLADELKFQIKDVDFYCPESIIKEVEKFKGFELLSVEKELGSKVKILKVTEVTKDNVLTV